MHSTPWLCKAPCEIFFLSFLFNFTFLFYYLKINQVIINTWNTLLFSFLHLITSTILFVTKKLMFSLFCHSFTGSFTYAHNFTVSLSAVFSTPKVQSIISTLLTDPTIYSLNVKSLGKTLQPHQYFHHLFCLFIPTNLFTITVFYYHLQEWYT